MTDQIFPDFVDPSQLRQVSPGHWEDVPSGYVYSTGTDFRPPAPADEQAETPADEQAETPAPEQAPEKLTGPDLFPVVTKLADGTINVAS